MNLQTFIASVLPAGTLNSIQDKAWSLLRSGVTRLLHPKHQSGLTLPEDGSLELRAATSNPLAASLTLSPIGTSQFISPGGVGLVGKLLLSGSPSEGLSFAYDTVTLNPLLEEVNLFYLTLEQGQELIAVYRGAEDPVGVPLKDLVTFIPVYINSADDPTNPRTAAFHAVSGLA